MLGYVAERLCLHLDKLAPTICYIHVNMAKAGAVTVVLVMFEEFEKEDFSKTTKKENLIGMVSLH